MPNITLLCTDCHKSFDFTEGEQEYFSRSGLTIPKRCPECRATRKQNKQRAYAQRTQKGNTHDQKSTTT